MSRGCSVVKEPRVLILSLYAGEGQFESCCRMLQSQEYKNWTHTVIRDLPEREAHQRLYQTVMENRDEFDYFMKLDADMVFSRRSALREAIAYLGQRPGLDHVVFAVDDWMTQAPILGIHVFSNRVSWGAAPRALYPDPDPHRPGWRESVWGDPAPFIIHSPEPSPYQAFQFGIHRAFKAFSRKKLISPMNALVQWRTLKRVWLHFTRSGDHRLGLAIFGAELVRRGVLEFSRSGFVCSEYERIFVDYEHMDSDHIRAALSPFWGQVLRREIWWSLVCMPRLLTRRSLGGWR